MDRLRGLAAGAVSGVLAALAFPPAGLSPLVFVALVPLLRFVHDRGGTRVGWPFAGFGVVFFAIGLSWLRTVLTPFGPAGLGIVLTLLFTWPSGHALGLILRRGGSLLVAAPAAFLLADWLRTFVLSGFPWLFLAHPLAAWGPLVQISDVLGAWGVTTLVVLVNAAIVLAWKSRSLRPFAAPAAAAAVFLVYGFVRPGTVELRPGPVVLLVQGNIPQFEKREIWSDPDPAGRIFEIHLELAAAAVRAHPEASVVVWPETMFPYLVANANEVVARPGGPPPIAAMARVAEAAGGRFSIVGSLARTDVGGNRNSVFLVDGAGGILGRYDKRRIVPGGEYVPLRDILPQRVLDAAGRLVQRTAGFVPNLTEGRSAVVLDAGGIGWSPLVCYETCYPGLVRDAVNAGADVLVNCSNYGWFPETAEPEQALQYGIFRAIEARRSLAVAANTGISCVVDPLGRVVARGGEDRREVVRGEVALSRSRSVYAAVGDVLPFASVFAVAWALLLTMMSKWRARERSRTA